VLIVYIINRYIKALIFNGIYNEDIFKGFIINKVVPLYNLYPNPRLVIILDNTLVYYKNRQTIKEVYRQYSVLVRFLPLYSPNFNPIKESFIDLKA
jgi:transposase